MPTVRETSQTPNPDAMKFTLDVPFDGMVNATSPVEAAADPLTAALLELPGVVSVFRTADFVTVTRESATSWDDLVPAVEARVAELD
jgi:hypothetical protein